MVDTRGAGDHSAYIGALYRMVRAAGRRYARADPVDLAELVALVDEAQHALEHAVVEQYLDGRSWADIAAGLGVTRQAAQKRWVRAVEQHAETT